MTEAERIWRTYSPQKREKLTEAYRRSCLFQIEQIKNGGWKWSDNFNREYMRCCCGESFSNTISPILSELVKRRWPEIASFVNCELPL